VRRDIWPARKHRDTAAAASSSLTDVSSLWRQQVSRAGAGMALEHSPRCASPGCSDDASFGSSRRRWAYQRGDLNRRRELVLRRQVLMPRNESAVAGIFAMILVPNSRDRSPAAYSTTSRCLDRRRYRGRMIVKVFVVEAGWQDRATSPRGQFIDSSRIRAHCLRDMTSMGKRNPSRSKSADLLLTKQHAGILGRTVDNR